MEELLCRIVRSRSLVTSGVRFSSCAAPLRWALWESREQRHRVVLDVPVAAARGVVVTRRPRRLVKAVAHSKQPADDKEARRCVTSVTSSAEFQ
jgi:hypothetical protein